MEINPTVLTNEFNHFFINSVKEITEMFQEPTLTARPIDPAEPVFSLKEITELDVAKIIGSLKNSKAKDVHGLDTNIIKLCKESLLLPITHMVNLSFKQKYVPLSWKMATVTPIFKSGNSSNIGNYRPISILPVVSKVAEKWVTKLINEHLNKDHSLLHPMQFGFREHHSTEFANCLFIEKIKHMLDSNPCVGAVFLDLKKAFDTVNHEILLSKLTYFNFSMDAIQWIKSYLEFRKKCVCINGVKSTLLDVPVGLPQGSILGPLLFSMYINDLPNTCGNVEFQMYADDAVIFTSAKNIQEAASILTSALVPVNEWLSKSCLLLNTTKTVCMMFTKQPLDIKHSGIFLEGQELEIVSKFKYLGVTLDSTLSFKSHIKKISNTVKFNLNNFKQIRPFRTLGAARMFLHSMILSHIEYCITCWSLAGVNTSKTIESLYKKSLKVLYRKPMSFHVCNILKKYKLLSFENFKNFKFACLMCKVLHGLAPPPMSDFF
uniref:Reverse transcriptase domain-containing protein n=1 Tax=Oryzias sinensis TaxID=183150 RepID=A0A8C7X350_9TELE